MTPSLRETPIALVAEDLCTGCGACIDACANGALSLGRPKVLKG
jgi:ferredoxin